MNGCIRRITWLSVVTALLFPVGLLFRIYSAFFYQCSPNPDLGINVLMAKHIAEGRHFPVFFYGQAYMGTAEAYIGALLYKFLSPSIFSGLLASALFSFAALIFLYLWVRTAFSRGAALFAAMLMLFGSSSLFYYNIFLGYPITLATGLACCWLSACIVKAPPDAAARSMWIRFAALGLFAGLGWWNNNLTIVVFVPCALVLLGCVSWKIMIRYAAGSVAGFIIGAYPWIHYTLFTRSDALEVVKGTSRETLAHYFQALKTAGSLAEVLFDASIASRAGMLVACITGLLLVLSIPALIIQARRNRPAMRSALLLFLPVMIIAVNVAACVLSARFMHVPAVRYLLPCAPAVFCLCGVALQWMIHQRGFRNAAWCSLLLLLVLQGMRVPNAWSREYVSGVHTYQERLKQLEQFCSGKGINLLRGDWFMHSLNIRTDERLRVCTYPDYDRYRPYRQEAALNTQTGIINDYGDFEAFLTRTESDANYNEEGLCHITWNIRKRKRPDYDYLAPDEMLNGRAENNAFFWRDLMDGNLDTPLPGHLDRGAVRYTNTLLHLEFIQPVSIAGLQVFGASGGRQYVDDIVVHAADGTDRHAYQHVPGDELWFWSGAYAFPGGYLNFTEINFPPIMARGVTIRLPVSQSGQPDVTELFIERTHSDNIQEPAAVEALIPYLNARPGAFVYAPRWISEHLHRDNPAIHTIIPQNYYAQYDGFDLSEEGYPRMTLDANTLLVLPHRSESITTNLLSKKGWMYQTEHIDPWTVIILSSNVHPETVHGNNALYWTEIGCLGADTVTAGRLDGVADVHQASGDILTPADIRFCNGIEFDGLTISTNQISRGEPLNISYFWHAPPDIQPDDWAVFVHFERGDSRFQDDHVFLALEPLAYIRTQPVPILFREEDHVGIPPDVPAGEYTLWVGMYDRKNGRRIVPHTALPVDHNKVKLPVSLHID